MRLELLSQVSFLGIVRGGRVDGAGPMLALWSKCKDLFLRCRIGLSGDGVSEVSWRAVSLEERSVAGGARPEEMRSGSEVVESGLQWAWLMLAARLWRSMVES